MPSLHKKLRAKIKAPTIYGASDQKITRFFIFNRAWIANERIVGLTALLVVGLGIIGYATFALPLNAPAGYVDGPAPGATVGGNSVVFSGWAVAASYVNHVEIYIDGQDRGTASYGTGAARPDVCAQYPQSPNCANNMVGWQFGIDSTGWANGWHSLSVSIYGSGGGLTTLPTQNFNIANQPPSIYVDTPSEGQTVSGSINVAGWAIDSASWPESPITQLSMSIDGVAIAYYPIYGAARPDVCAAYPARPGCNNVGFNYSLDTTNVPNGWRAMHITAVDGRGNSSTYTRTVYFSNSVVTPPSGPGTTTGGGGGGGTPPPATSKPPEGFVDNPGPPSSSGVLALAKGPAYIFSGYAIDKETAIQTVEVLVDGKIIGTAKYGGGTLRTDVCTPARTGYNGCIPGLPNYGHLGWQLSYDTTKLTNGTHNVQIRIADSSQPAQYTIIPPHNFKVDNPPPPTTAGGGTTSILLPPDLYIDNINDPGTTVTTASGWALDNAVKIQGKIAKVTVSVNGRLIGTAHYGGTNNIRNDVCGPTQYPSRANCPQVGWNITFDSSGLPSGSNTLQVTATNSFGLTRTASKTFLVNVTGGNGTGGGGRGAPTGKVAPLGEMDKINDLTGVNQDNTSGSILITGWAIDGLPDRANYNIDHVEIYVDKVDAAHDQGHAKYGYGNAIKTYRQDVCVILDQLSAQSGGPAGDRGNIPCPNIGWSYYLDTRGNFKDGTHTLFAKVFDRDSPTSRTFTMKRDFVIENNSGGGRTNVETPPIGGIDLPPEYDAATKTPILSRGNYTFKGWAMDKDSKISEVRVLLDGYPIGKKPIILPGAQPFENLSGKAKLGKSRPDVCAAHKNYLCPQGAAVGWEYTVDVGKLDLPTTGYQHMIVIQVVDSDTPDHHMNIPDPSCGHIKCPGLVHNFSRVFHVDTPFTRVTSAPLGTIDNPGVDSQPLKDTVNFNGWGLDSSADPITAISHVTYSFDNKGTVSNASYGTGNPRTDVCDMFTGPRPGCIPGQPNYGKVGWQFDVDTHQLTNGAHTVHVHIYDSDNPQNEFTIDRDFKVNNPQPPSSKNLPPDVLIESVTPNGATTQVKGWAIDNMTQSESAVSKVDITLVDGINISYLGTANYGGLANSRAGVCLAYPGRPGCPNVGWNYSFDSSSLYNGDYTIRATATDASGLSRSVDQHYTVSNNPAPQPVLQNRSQYDRPDDPAVGSLPQIHAVYMVPVGGRDRQLDINGRIDTSVASTQGWLASQSGGKRLRYDTYNNGANLDVTFVPTGHDLSYYANSGMNISNLVQADAEAAGLNSPNKIYSIYFEGGSVSACGLSLIPGHYPQMYFFGTYPDGLGPCIATDLAKNANNPYYLDFVSLHEIFHSLGAVQPCAPHFAGGGNYHTSDLNDLMEGVGNFPVPPVITLDPGSDDYFGANVLNCLNIANSPYFK